MPKFWQKAGKFLSEAVSTGRLKDEDYRSAYSQMSNTESGIISLKSILHSFTNITEPFRKNIKILNESITKIYKETPFKDHTESIIIKNQKILEDIDSINKTISKLYSKTSEWEKIFEKAKESRKIRNEKKKTFEHYEKKLREINEDKKKCKDSEFVKRNEEKYSLAISEYIECSEKSFYIIIESLKLSWDLINPVVADFINEQKKFFENVSTRLVDFDNLNENLKEIKEKTFSEESTEDNYYYDPKKFIIDKSLMKKIQSDHIIIKNSNESNAGKIFLRTSNSFGKIPIEKQKMFQNIQDDLFLGV